MSRVIVVGSINEDVLVRAPIPTPGETVAARDDFALLPGGKGANAACAAARLGAPTSLIGAVGADAAGDRALASLRAGGVAVGRVERAPGVGTGQAIVVVDDAGENAIVIAAGANATIMPAQVAKAIDTLAVPGAVVLSNLEIPFAAVVAAARAAAAHGLHFLLDPTPARSLPPELIPPGALIVPNEHELATVAATAAAGASGVGEPGAPAVPADELRAAGAASAATRAGAAAADAAAAAATDAAHADALLAAGAGAVIVTRGAAGADLHAAAGAPPRRFPAPRVEVVDTTGAGDAFRGALAAALAAGEGLEEAVADAVAAGAHATTAPGARGTFADRAEVTALRDRIDRA